MVMRKCLAGLLGLGVALLGGCGGNPASAPKTTKPETPVLQPIAPPEDGDLDGKKALERLRAAAPAVTTLSAKSRSWQYLPDGSLDHCRAEYWLRRSGNREPFTMAAYVHEAKDKRTERTKIIFDGRSQVRLKTYFLGFLAVKATLAYNDKRLVDSYGRTFKDTTLEQMLAVLLHPAAKTRQIGTYVMRGERLQLLEIQSPAIWKDASKEIFGLSERTGMPIYRDTFNKRGKIFRHFDVEGLRTQVKFGGSEFSLD